MNFEEIVNHRRSVRLYDAEKPIDSAVVKDCLKLASLSPNSSNMQLWEFYHVTEASALKKLAYACLSQQSATTAHQMVVFITRQDLYREHAAKMLKLETENVRKNTATEKQQKRIERWKLYYTRVMPFLYFRFFGLVGLVRKIAVSIIGLFRPIFREVKESDARVVIHKTCALAAQTFMLAMSEKGYDTCPMEGFDSRLVKKLLRLPSGAEINMVVSCGIRKEGGVWGDRMRLPFEEIYHEVK